MRISSTLWLSNTATCFSQTPSSETSKPPRPPTESVRLRKRLYLSPSQTLPRSSGRQIKQSTRSLPSSEADRSVARPNKRGEQQKRSRRQQRVTCSLCPMISRGRSKAQPDHPTARSCISTTARRRRSTGEEAPSRSSCIKLSTDRCVAPARQLSL